MISNIDSDDSVHIIDKSTTISIGKTTLFEYDYDTGVLAINISEDFLVNLNLGENPVDLCFPVPDKQREHYCFKNVSKIKRIEQKKSLINRFTKFLLRK